MRTSGEFGARASHCSVIVNDAKIWVIGGAHFTGVNNSLVVVYDIADSSWRTVATKNAPKARYDHTVVRYKVSILARKAWCPNRQR
ncbi:unnamed protein product [Gongylonema pulchrum]|uniref:Galactose oxidase n=1 Tax=Gongylonema pulchrum TaxID=637853 RepID=A0A183DJQ9_9BILA|nr:unnamed protein product [Gongylonema pulchrum]